MADPPVRAAAPAVFRPPTGEDLVTAVLTGDAAVRPIRDMFRAAAPHDHVRGLLVQAVDPLLLEAVLGPDIAPPWVSLLERYYAQARRRSPATFLDFDRAWADQRRRWQPLADGAEDPGAAQEAAVEPDTALDVPGRGVAADGPLVPVPAGLPRSRSRPRRPVPPVPRTFRRCRPKLLPPPTARTTTSSTSSIPGSPRRGRVSAVAHQAVALKAVSVALGQRGRLDRPEARRVASELAGRSSAPAAARDSEAVVAQRFARVELRKVWPAKVLDGLDHGHAASVAGKTGELSAKRVSRFVDRTVAARSDRLDASLAASAAPAPAASSRMAPVPLARPPAPSRPSATRADSSLPASR